MFTGLILSGVLAAVPQLPASPPAPPVQRQTPDAAYARLFEVTIPTRQSGVDAGERQQGPGPLPQPTPRTAPRSKVVCGTTVIVVGSEADPKMAQPTPKNGVTYTIRRYPPPACGQDK